MSRFFAGSDSDSDSSSSEEPVQRPAGPTIFTVTLSLKWSHTALEKYQFQFSDDEEEVKRVVRSAKEKRYEELTSIIKQIRNFKKIKDMSSMLNSA